MNLSSPPRFFAAFLCLIAFAGCSPPSSTVTISSEAESNKALHDVVDGPDAQVRIEIADMGALVTIKKVGDTVTLVLPDGKTPETTMSVLEFRKKLSEGEMTRCKSNLKNLATAVEMWSTDNRGRYPKKVESVVPNYIKEIPRCPRVYEDTYSASYKATADPAFFEFSCKGEHHKAAGVPADYPRYNSTVGLINQP
jgi:hypothetical protein